VLELSIGLRRPLQVVKSIHAMYFLFLDEPTTRLVTLHTAEFCK